MFIEGKKRILVTGAAGFIGSSLVIKLLEKGHNVLGIDNLNNYYDMNFKLARLDFICANIKNSEANWTFKKNSIENKDKLFEIFNTFKPEIVVNLAAQAGVRYSLENPDAYIQSNIVGFTNILEACRKLPIENFVYASSSSVYGGNKSLPFHESHNVDQPISLYAATKKSNELMAHSYSHLYGIPSIGLRFFTVYGPWGRPDMAPFIFTNSIANKKPINIFNYGDMKRDFTYISDVVESIIRCCFKPITKNEFSSSDQLNKETSCAPHKIFNVGNNKSIKLKDFISLLEKELNIMAIKNFVEMQPGDVKETESDSSELYNWIKFKPLVTINEGVPKFIKWYKSYYKID